MFKTLFGAGARATLANPWVIGGLALAFAGAVLGAVVWFNAQIAAAEHRGALLERAKWNEAVRLTEQARESERVAAERALEVKRAELIETEDALAAERQKRREDLAARIREQHAPIVIPDSILETLREIGR